MVEFRFSVSKFGDPLLELAATPANLDCIIDRKNLRVFLGVSDLRFPSLKEEVRMLWLREHGIVSDALNPDYRLPDYAEELLAVSRPPEKYSPSTEVPISLEQQVSRESIAWFARSVWQLLETDGIPEDQRGKFQLHWKNHSGEEFKAPLKDFLRRPKIISQTGS